MGTYNTNRKEDTRLEKLVNEYLDKKLFNREDSFFKKVKWVDDPDLQISGVDIILDAPDLGIENGLVDIKSAVKYSNKYLGTYALECSFIGKNGLEKVGWLIDKTKTTQYYLLLYPRSQKYYTDMQTPDDIDYIEYYLVDRNKILNYLSSRGYDKQRIMETVCDMRRDFIPGDKGLNEDSTDPAFRFYLTGTLAEQPVNVVISRSVYDKISILHDKI